MLVEEKIMEVLAAYDLTNSFRSAAALCGADQHTVRRYVAARDAGLDPTVIVPRASVSDPFCDKICEWIGRSQGRVRADVVHRRLEAMGYRGSERTTRRVVAALRPSGGGPIGGVTGRGSLSRVCGCSGTMVTARRWRVAGPCSVRGWRGPGSG